MPFPVLAAVAAGTGLLSSIFGNKAAKQTNQINAQQLANEKRTTDQQIKISDYLQSLTKELMAKGSTQVDPYGGTTGYDPATGTYRTSLGHVPQNIQNASDAEELSRFTIDQELRRRGLQDAEGIRAAAAGETGGALTDLNNFRRGIGAVDPVALAARMRLDRQGAINAGYDDAARAAQTMGLRTGSSAISDALTAIARDRVRAQAQIGDPEVEAIQLAENINSNRANNLLSRYDVLSNKGSNFYDAGFQSAPYAGIADSKLADAMKLDLSKYEIAQGGSSAAAATIGNAAANLREGFKLAETNRVKNPNGDLISSIGRALTGFGSAAGFG